MSVIGFLQSTYEDSAQKYVTIAFPNIIYNIPVVSYSLSNPYSSNSAIK
jgi:hypothetical protein